MHPARPAPVIHVVNNDESFQASVARALYAAGYQIVSYTSGAEFLGAHIAQHSHCILLGVNLPDTTGFEIQRILRQHLNPLPIIFVSDVYDIAMAVQAMKSGATDFLIKPIDDTQLLSAIQAAVARHTKNRLDFDQIATVRARLKTLTMRELDVFKRVTTGKINRDIASELGTSERTVKAHRAHVMTKMRATSLAELVHLANLLEASNQQHTV